MTPATMKLEPGSPEWRERITASKVGAILGISPFKSQYTMWHEMAGNVDPAPINENDAKFGHFAELMLGPWWESLEDGRHLGEREPSFENERGWVATPDFIATDSDGTACVVECKTTKDLDDWADSEGEPAVPAHYYAQVLFQLAVSERPRGYVVVLGPFKQVEVHRIDFDPELWAGVEEQLISWEESLAAGTPPELDDSVSTYNTARKLHPEIERDLCWEIDEKEAVALLDAQHAFDDADRRLKAQKSKHLAAMGKARELTCDGVTVARRQPNKSGVSFYVNKKAELNG